MKNLFEKVLNNVNGEGFLPCVSIDPVIFGYHNNQLKVLLLEYKNSGFFLLPGGYVREKEDLDLAARRIVSERTGLYDIFLKQFYTFGDSDRCNGDNIKTIITTESKASAIGHWMAKRFISVGYYALVDFTKVIPKSDADSIICCWYDIRSLPELILDHRQIIEKSLNSLGTGLDYNITGFHLMYEAFTMGELQNLYETILNRKLLRTNFQRKMLGLGILERLKEKREGVPHKSPYLYKFKNYNH